MIIAEIHSDKDDSTSTLTGENINEIIDKIKIYHEMSDFEKKIIIKKDDFKANRAWYLK